MTDAAEPPQISNYVGDSLTPVHRFSAHACMASKICTTAWL
jgi:hypothetical protein